MAIDSMLTSPHTGFDKKMRAMTFLDNQSLLSNAVTFRIFMLK
jgi:hypothetical protein